MLISDEKLMSNVRKHTHLFFHFMMIFIMGIFLSSCNTADSEKLQALTGVENKKTVTVTGTPAPNTSRLRIFTLTGNTSVGSQTMTLNDNIDLRAVLVDDTGALLTEVEVQWWVSGSLNNDDLTVTGGNPAMYATFDALTASTGLIHATILDSAIITQYNVANNTTSTGTISVSSNLVADTIQVTSGDSQTGQVGSTLALPLKIRVLTSAAIPVPGKSVTFSISAGGGTIVTAQPVITDSSGYAECLVKVGGVVGSLNNSYTASMSGGSVNSVSLSASATPGAAYKLAFNTQPAGANVNSPFSTQPEIEVRDSYGNKVTSAANSITLSTGTGTGVVGGTATMNASSGVATFSDIQYSVAENSVVLTASSAGLISASSNAFNVGNVIAGAQCNVGINGWQTGEGGCRDMTNGLVWSAVSAGTYTWHQAAWDSNYTANLAEAWETALGLTHDLTGYPHANTQDGNISAYCHDLTESGYSDWRLPTVGEIYAANIASGDQALQNANTNIWTGNNVNTTPACTAAVGNKCHGNISSATALGIVATSLRNVRCVRRPLATKLIFYQQPAAATRGFGIYSPFETQPVIRVVDSQDRVVTNSTASVTIIALDGSTGSLLGTTTKSAVSGVVTFTDLYYTSAESIRLQATSAGLSSATSNSISIQTQLPIALCKSTASPAYFVNADGGCKDKTTGFIFSARSPSVMANWGAAMWDSVNLTTFDDDTYDNSKTDDYDLAYPTTSNHDGNTTNYCHNLRESGFQDWKVPPWAVLSSITGKLPTQSVNFHSTNLWTSATLQATPTSAYYVTSANVMATASKGSNTLYAVCVRQDPPSQLSFTQQPSGGTNGFGIGISWTTQPVVKILDAQGAVLYGRTDPITLTVVKSDGTPATGNLYISNTLQGQTVTVNAVNGVATFSGLNYDTAGEAIKLVASMPSVTWNGVAINVPDEESNAITIPTQYAPSLCQAGGNWSSQNGGCQDILAGGKVWSNVLWTSYDWYVAIWDSALGGASPQDAYDGVRTNDYDAALPPLATTDISTTSACHNLRLNGYQDWRIPTYAELDTGLKSTNRSGYNRLNRNGVTYIWSGATQQADSTKAYIFRMDTGAWHTSTALKSTVGYGILCVRDP